MPRERNDGPRFHDRCRFCGRPFPCRDCLSDKDADRWVAENAPGADVPKENDRRLLGGNLDRTDRGDPQELLRALDLKRRGAIELRHYLEIVEARLQVIGRAEVALESERAHYEVRRTVLAMTLEGDGADQVDIATALGRRSHSTVSDLLTTIRAEASERYAQRVVVSTPCASGRGCVVTGHAATGRPRKWCRRCEKARHSERTVEARRRRRRRFLSATLSATGGAVEVTTPAAPDGATT